MPEGHTIHRVARDHRRLFAGQQTAMSSPQGRFETEARELSGSVLQDVSAHGKHLFYHWSEHQMIHVHLGLYGKFRLHKNPAPQPRGAVRLRMMGRERTFDLNGPNRCRLIDRDQFLQILSRLGPDPLSAKSDPDLAWDRIQKSRSPIGTLLLNQSVIAGIGNVYRAEILFLLGIDPETPAHCLERSTFDRMWELTVRLMKLGVKYNSIITVPPVPGQSPRRLRAAERLNVYKQAVCPNCSQPIENWNLGNRTIYACRKCQTR